jgi:hypothetical protein
MIMKHWLQFLSSRICLGNIGWGEKTVLKYAWEKLLVKIYILGLTVLRRVQQLAFVMTVMDIQIP